MGGQELGIKAIVLGEKNKKRAITADVLVSTPNRLVYWLREDPDVLGFTEHLVIDESDKLFEAGSKGFREQLATVYRSCPNSVQRAMFSATLAADVEQWCKLNLDNAVQCCIGIRNTATEKVEQSLVYTGTEKGKLLALYNLIREGVKPPVLIFVQEKERAKELFEELKSDRHLNLKVDVIHSGRSELQRDAAVRAFRAGRVWLLICTEILGRGIDFKGVNLVINYDFPPSTISYIHRIGRTGRGAGNVKGKAVTFFTDSDKTLLRSIAQLVKSSGGQVPEYMLKMKKASRQEKRKLAANAVSRESIKQESKYDKEKRLKKEQMIEASKKRKRKREKSMQEEEERKEEEEEIGHESVDVEPKKKRNKTKKSKSRRSIVKIK